MRKVGAIVSLSAAALFASCSSVTAYDGESAAAPVPAPASVAAAPASAQEALRPYYASLDIRLPVAPKGPELAPSTTLTRFAFGSCVNENRDMAFWDRIAAQNPQAFLFIGDNVYGDTGTTNAADIPTLPASYRKLSSRQEFARFRAQVPMMTTWDDHDYGANDAGGSFAFKEWAEKVFETYWDSSAEVKSRPGIYESRMIGPEGKRVQFIILDTRYFRSDLARMPYQAERPPLGWYIPTTDPRATILGDAQWQWLEQELSKPADLRFIVSSIQIITDAHNYESWENFPNERKRLYALLAEKNIDNAFFLSGDRHSGAIYKEQVPGFARPLWDFTSSSLNFAFGDGDSSAREPDPKRVGGFWSVPNFGQVDIDWADRKITMSLRRDDTSVLETQTVGF